MASDLSTTLSTDPFLRVRADKVTQLLDLVGELGLAAQAVTHHAGLNGLELEGFDIAAHRLEMLVHEAQDLASALRLVPVGQAFRRMQRVVRDLAQQTGKLFDVVLEGEEVEIDKAVVDQLSDPLMHLIRNAADHGLEPTSERARLGKPEKGHITLAAAQHGREIHITVADDGRGLNRAAILQRARERGLARADETPEDKVVWNYIFQSGFSTAQAVTNLSGRGVGMDVVQNTIRALRGRVEVQTWVGQGTRITLAIPLTLAFLESMVVRTQDRLYAIPIDSVSEIFQPGADTLIRSSASGETLILRQGAPVPLVSLEATGPLAASTALAGQIVVVAQVSGGTVGLLMDAVIGQQQVVMKPLTGHLRDIRGGVGCALLSSGEVAVALDVEQLVTAKGH
jgi:two-component system, chemotaxis family, sensor kinase CheA